MMSIKKVTISIVLFLLVIIFVLMYFTFTVTHSRNLVTKESFGIYTSAYTIVTINEKVLNSTEDLNKDVLDKIESNVDKINNSYQAINSIAKNISTNPFFSRLFDTTMKIRLDKVGSRVKKISVDFNQVDTLKELRRFNLEVSQVKREMFEILQELPTSFEKNFNRFVIANIILYSSVIISVLSILLLLIKLISRNSKYIATGVDLLANHDYDIKKLPSFHPVFRDEYDMRKKVNDIIEEQAFIQNIKDIANKEYILEDVMDQLFIVLENNFRIDRISVAFLNHSDQKIVMGLSRANYEVKHIDVGYEIDYNQTRISNLIDTKEVMVNNDLLRTFEKTNSESNRLILEEGIQSNIIIPLIIDESVFGFLFFSSREKNHFSEEMINIAKHIAFELAGIMNKSYLTMQIFSEITYGFADLVEKKDYETGEHIIRMVEYSTFIAQLLENHSLESYRLGKQCIRDIKNNAAVHDIGKVGIPDKILKKAGRLTPKERKEMEEHTVIGGDIFSNLRQGLRVFEKDFYIVAENISRYHHERWDGTGYPEGLMQEQIPLEARIVAIADVFDALSSERTYKEAYPFEKSFNILLESSGTHLDPVLIDQLNINRKAFKKIYEKYH